MSKVRVAVRVRPLNAKEKEHGSTEIVQVYTNSVQIENIKLRGVSEFGDTRSRSREFLFDHCYDCMKGRTNLSSQVKVFEDLGTDVLRAAIDGFNACVFAYGQTGTGKTHTMMGQPNDVGLIPRICEGLFNHVSQCQDENVTFRIDVSYFEIYNERVRDLLKPYLHKQNDKYSLKVREHPKDGPYVQDLSWHHVKNNEEIQVLLKMGNEHRVTAETYMHNDSSRSHAIVTVSFTQAHLEENMPSEIISKINLVDLAGSERADPNSRPDFRKRLTEGANINKSLVTLGYVIKSLAERSLLSWSPEDTASQSCAEDQAAASSSSKQRVPYIPYRDSILTWLLKDSLGGNARTIMIATITPASHYYNESINTLRYAQRAKNIINKPRVNEDRNVALIRELRQEVERLSEMLANAQMSPDLPEDIVYYVPNLPKDFGLDSQGGNLVTLPNSEDSIIAKKLHENEERAKKLTQNWMFKWSSAEDMQESDLSIQGIGNRTNSLGLMIDSQLPYLVGMDDDILSTGIVIFNLKEGDTLVGREDAEVQQDIGDYVVLGGNQVFRFNNPREAAKLREHRKSQGSLNNLSTSYQSFGGLSRASSFTSIGADDTNYLSPHSQLNKFYPNARRHSDIILDLERRYQSEQERLDEAKKELDRLKAEHEKAEEQRQIKEEEMYEIHEQHKAEIEEQKHQLAMLIEANEMARAKAEAELKMARESLTKEKEAFQKQLDMERKRLKEILGLERQQSLATQTDPLSPQSSVESEDDKTTISSAVGTDVTFSNQLVRSKGGRMLSAGDQLQELEADEFSHRMSYRETEQCLAMQQEDIEDLYQQTQEQIQNKIEKIQQIEEKYKEMDKAHLHEIVKQAEKLSELKNKEVQLEVYIQENEELIDVRSHVPSPLRSAQSEMFLLDIKLQYPQKTASLHDIQAKKNSEDVIESPRSRSLQRSVSAEIVGGEPDKVLNIQNETSIKKDTNENKISSVAQQVTNRLYQAAEPKFRYVPKIKDHNTKSVTPSNIVNNLDVASRSSPVRVTRSERAKSESPRQPVNKSGTSSCLYNETETKKRSNRKCVNNKSESKDITARSKSSNQNENSSAASEVNRTSSPVRLNVGPMNQLSSKSLTPVLKHMTSTSCLASVPESQSENENYAENAAAKLSNPDISSYASTPVKRRNKKGRSTFEDEDFRCHSAPDSQRVSRALELYIQVMDNNNVFSLNLENSLEGLPLLPVSVLVTDSDSNENCSQSQVIDATRLVHDNRLENVCDNSARSAKPIDETNIVHGDMTFDADAFVESKCEGIAKVDPVVYFTLEDEITTVNDKECNSVFMDTQDKAVLGTGERKEGDINDDNVVPNKKSKPVNGNNGTLSTNVKGYSDGINKKYIETMGIDNNDFSDDSLALDISVDSLEDNEIDTQLSQRLPIDLIRNERPVLDDSLVHSLEQPKTDRDVHMTCINSDVDKNFQNADVIKVSIEPLVIVKTHTDEITQEEEFHVTTSNDKFCTLEQTDILSSRFEKNLLIDLQNELLDSQLPYEIISEECNTIGLEKIDLIDSTSEIGIINVDYDENVHVEYLSQTSKENHKKGIESVIHFAVEEVDELTCNVDIKSYLNDVIYDLLENVPEKCLESELEELTVDSNSIESTKGTVKLMENDENIQNHSSDVHVSHIIETVDIEINVARNILEEVINNEDLNVDGANSVNEEITLTDENSNLFNNSISYEEVEVLNRNANDTSLCDSDKTVAAPLTEKVDSSSKELHSTSQDEHLGEHSQKKLYQEMQIEKEKTSAEITFPNILRKNNDNFKPNERDDGTDQNGNMVVPESELLLTYPASTQTYNDVSSGQNDECVIDADDDNQVFEYMENGNNNDSSDAEQIEIDQASITEMSHLCKSYDEHRIEVFETSPNMSARLNDYSLLHDHLDTTLEVDDIASYEVKAENLDNQEDNARMQINNSSNLPLKKSVGVGTSMEMLDIIDYNNTEDNSSLCSSDSLLDAHEELQMLQEALEKLPAKNSGPHLSVAQRAARKRAMKRNQYRVSDGTDQLSDESPCIGHNGFRTKPSNRQASGSVRRKRCTIKHNVDTSEDVNKLTTDDYDSSENDSEYTNDSLDELENESTKHGVVHANVDDNHYLEDDKESVELRHKQKQHDHFSQYQDGQIPDSTEVVKGSDGRRTVGIQTLDHLSRRKSSASILADLSNIDSSLASSDLVVLPLSLCNSNNRSENEFQSDRNLISLADAAKTPNNDYGIMPPTAASALTCNTSAFSDISSLNKGPTEVLSSNTSELHQLPSLPDDLSNVIETEGVSLGCSKEYSEDSLNQHTSIYVPTPSTELKVILKSDSSTSMSSGKAVNILYPDSHLQHVGNGEAITPVKFNVIVDADNTNVVNNEAKTENKTDAQTQPSTSNSIVVPDTINVKLIDNVSFDIKENCEYRRMEEIQFHLPDMDSENPVLERSFSSSNSSELKLKTENVTIETEMFKEETSETDEEAGYLVRSNVKLQVPSRQGKVNQLQNFGVVESINVEISPIYAEDEKSLFHNISNLGRHLFESDHFHDHVTIACTSSILNSFPSDSNEKQDAGFKGSPAVSLEDSHILNLRPLEANQFDQTNGELINQKMMYDIPLVGPTSLPPEDHSLNLTIESPITAGSKKIESPITVDSTTTESPITIDSSITVDSKTIESSFTIDSKTIESPITADSKTIESPITVNVKTIESPITVDSKTIESSVTIDAKTIESPNTVDSKSIEPSITGNSKTIESPITVDSTTMKSPITVDSKSTETPFTGDLRKIQSAVTVDSMTIESPITVDSTIIESPITVDSTIIESPITDDSRTTESPIADDSRTTESPIADDSRTTESPIADDSTTIESPITVASTITESLITDDSTTTESLITGDSTTTESPISVDSKTTESPIIDDAQRQPSINLSLIHNSKYDSVTCKNEFNKSKRIKNDEAILSVLLSVTDQFTDGQNVKIEENDNGQQQVYGPLQHNGDFHETNHESVSKHIPEAGDYAICSSQTEINENLTLYIETNANKNEISKQSLQQKSKSNENNEESRSVEQGRNVTEQSTNICSSDNKTPQQPPKMYSKFCTIAKIQDAVISNLLEDENVPIIERQKAEAVVSDEALILTSSPVKPNEVKTVSINTESLPSTIPSVPPVASRNIHICKHLNDQVLTKRKDIEIRIAKLKCHVRSLSDSAISSDFTDLELSPLSPKGSRFYDSDRSATAENRLLHADIGTYSKNAYTELRRVLDFEKSQDSKLSLKDSGNVFDDDKNNELASFEKCPDRSIMEFQRSLSLNSISYVMKGMAEFSKSVIDGKNVNDDMSCKGTKIDVSKSDGLFSSVGMEYTRSLSPGEIVLDQIDQCIIDDMCNATEHENKAAALPIQSCTSQTNPEKHISLLIHECGQNIEYHRSLSEGNLGNFNEDNNSTSSSNDSITFVFVCKDSNLELEQNYESCEEQEMYYDPCGGDDMYGSESESSDSRTYPSPEHLQMDKINISGKEDPPSTDSKDEDLSSNGRSNCLAFIDGLDDEQSAHTTSEEIQKITHNDDYVHRSRNIIDCEADSSANFLNTSDGLVQNTGVRNVHDTDSEPLRHRFGIDESVLPISERSVSVDNIPKYMATLQDINRSQSTGMISVGVEDESESESPIFPPAQMAYFDVDHTDVSVSLRTMSESNLDFISRRITSALDACHSNRTSQDLELDSFDTEDDSSAIVRSINSTSSSMEEVREEFVIQYSYNTDHHKMKPTDDSESEINTENVITEEEENFRNVLETIQKLIMPGPTVVERGMSTDNESASSCVSIGVQTYFVDTGTQTPAFGPDQIILSASTRAHNIDMLEGHGLDLSQGSSNWYTLANLMVETTKLLRRINDKLPNGEMINSVSSVEASQPTSQFILQQWQEISVQTSQSLNELHTVGLQTEVDKHYEYKLNLQHVPETCANSTQVDTEFKMELLEQGVTVTSELLPDEAASMACAVSVQTENVNESETYLNNFASIFIQPGEVKQYLNWASASKSHEFIHERDKLTNTRVTDDVVLLASCPIEMPNEDIKSQQSEDVKLEQNDFREVEHNKNCEVVYKKGLEVDYNDDLRLENNDTSLTSPQSLSQQLFGNKYVDLAADRDQATITCQQTLEKSLTIPVNADLDFGKAPVMANDQTKVDTLDKDTLSNQSKLKKEESSGKLLPWFTFPDTKEFQELCQEHAKLMENLRKASDERKVRKEIIQSRKLALSNESQALTSLEQNQQLNFSNFGNAINESPNRITSFSGENVCESSSIDANLKSVNDEENQVSRMHQSSTLYNNQTNPQVNVHMNSQLESSRSISVEKILQVMKVEHLLDSKNIPDNNSEINIYDVQDGSDVPPAVNEDLDLPDILMTDESNIGDKEIFQSIIAVLKKKKMSVVCLLKSMK